MVGCVSFVVDSLLYVPPIVCGSSVFGLSFWYALLCVFSSFAIILTRKRELVVLI